jgi:hypothetical protein
MIGGYNGGGEAAIEDIDVEALADEPEGDDEGEAGEDVFDFLKQYTPLGLLGLGGSRAGGAGRYYQPPAAVPFVTQSQLRRSLNSVRRDVRGLSTRVNVVQTATTRVARDVAAQRKTSNHHSKLIKDLRNELNQTREMNMIMTLLMQPKALDPTSGANHIGNVDIPPGTRFNYQTGENSAFFYAMLLPALLGEGSSEKGLGSSMGLLIAMLAFGGGLKF